MKSILKYVIILPILLISFSCDETVTDSTVYNGDILGSWMLTGLTGTYTYTVGLPEASESGLTWAADTSFGIRLKWEHEDNAAFGGALAGKATFPLPATYQPTGNHGAGDTVLWTQRVYELTDMVADTFGLIGVFDDAPSSGSDATYKMKGVYPGVFYNYSMCASQGSTAPMTDQGLYAWDQTSNNFTIKRDPVQGDQVLPTFDDGTLTVSDTSMNIKFLDRDSHSTRYLEIMDSWDEGTHPDVAYGGNGLTSSGDRTYFAFPPLITDSDGAIAGAFDGSNGIPVIGTTAYLKQASLASWSGYMTWYAYCFSGEMQYLATIGAITDAGGDGSMADDLVGYMVANNSTGTTYGTGIPYSLLVSTLGAITDDSVVGDVAMTNLAAGGKMKFNVISDCAVPVDVTIDFDATFTKCTTDNCAGDGYHVAPTWD